MPANGAAINEGSWNQFASSSAAGTDEVDLGSANSLDVSRTKAAIESTQQKITRTKDMIKAEQTARDGGLKFNHRHVFRRLVHVMILNFRECRRVSEVGRELLGQAAGATHQERL